MNHSTLEISMFGCNKFKIRKTGEEIEVIAFQADSYGARTEDDWVSYIDSEGKEHIKEHMNLHFDCKPADSDMYKKLMNSCTCLKYVTTENNRIFEVAKSLILDGKTVIEAISVAKELVSTIGVEYEN